MAPTEAGGAVPLGSLGVRGAGKSHVAEATPDICLDLTFPLPQ